MIDAEWNAWQSSWTGATGPQSAQTHTPTEYVLKLAQQFDGGEIPGLAVKRPSLEDVYLEMIGGGAARSQDRSRRTGEQS